MKITNIWQSALLDALTDIISTIPLSADQKLVLDDVNYRRIWQILSLIVEQPLSKGLFF
jgi:hypothetical protein